MSATESPRERETREQYEQIWPRMCVEFGDARMSADDSAFFYGELHDRIRAGQMPTFEQRVRLRGIKMGMPTSQK